MTITVETGRWAARYVDSRIISLKMPDGLTVADAIRATRIPEDEAGIAIVGGKAVPREQRLSDGDVLKIHPVIVGG